MAECQAHGGCSETQLQRIYEYLDGALSPEDLEEICGHLNECAACAREHDMEQLIRSAVRRSCCEAAPETLKGSIMSRIDALRESNDGAGHEHGQEVHGA